MSEELVLSSLTKLGLKKTEAKVYFYLAKKGPKNAIEIRKTLGISKQQLYPILRALKNKAVINATIDRPALFSAVQIEKVLDILCNAKIDEAKNLQNKREKLLRDWKSISENQKDCNESKFIVIKGKKYLFSKIQQMIEDTKSSFCSIVTLSSFFQINQFGALDSIRKKSSNFQTNFRFITDITNQKMNPIKELIQEITPNVELKVKNPDLGLSLFPKMIIKDNKEILYFISSQNNDIDNNNGYLAIFSDCKSLIEPFSKVFEDLWNNSTDINQKIMEVENGKISSQTTIINDPRAAMEKYYEVLENLKKEILFVVTSKSLLTLSNDMKQLKNWKTKGLKIKILSPITTENIDAAKRLSSFCIIKHVPFTYVETTIVDNQHFFQFSKDNTPPNKSKIEKYRGTFYSNDPERVQKSKKMLENIWNNSCNPSMLSVNSLFEGLNIDEYRFKFHQNVQNVKILNNKKEVNRLSEQDVLNKIIDANPKGQNNPSKNIICCSSMGFALVHPPDYLKLPDILVGALHIDKKSSLGAEDAIMVYFSQKTLKGFKYVPVALYGDNPRGTIAKNNQTRGTPAEKNRRLVDKDQINIQVHGNTLFAEWKMPINIMKNKYTLPPAAILLESYGKIRSHSYSTIYPNGVKNNWALNSFEAFVTFMHKDSKYTGPGTDGLLIRDAFIETIIP